ncbi:MAG TPA: alpha/beta hydrolase [Chloroflexota bacterium]|nr:alpha/beta hydrolase [Chloroflexota bacterium]
MGDPGREEVPAVPRVRVNHLDVYYETHGARDGPALVLLHGFMSSGAAWSEQLEALGERYRLVVPDWRGHGRTANPAGPEAMTHRQFARDVIGLCQALGLEGAIFCGHSSGAMQLLTLGLEAPGLARALILCAGTYFFADELRAWWRTQTPESVTDAARRETLRAAHTAEGLDHWRTVVAAWLALAGHAHGDDFPEPEALPGLEMPVLLVHGDRDRFFPVEVPAQLYGMLPDAELCLLPRTGHGLPRERAGWFNTIVLDFLARRATVER